MVGLTVNNEMRKTKHEFHLASTVVVAVVTLCGLGNAAGSEATDDAKVQAANSLPSDDKAAASDTTNFNWPQLLGSQYTWVRQHQSSLRAP